MWWLEAKGTPSYEEYADMILNAFPSMMARL
jgi:hypothetical protein